jgi:hypothetical protein
MAEQTRPNVVGKGPALSREMLDIFSEISKNSSKLSDIAKEKIVLPLEEKSVELEKVIKMAYLKTVKAGEVAWDLKEKTLVLKEKLDGGDETAALTIMAEIQGELDEFIHKIKTFVVRMT